MLLPTLLIALAAPAAGACDDATSTAAIVACIDREAQAADRRLNTAYRTARTRVSPAQAQRLLAAQRAWIAFRDANCRAYAAGEGSVTRIEAAQCRRDTTAARAAELSRFARRS